MGTGVGQLCKGMLTGAILFQAITEAYDLRTVSWHSREPESRSCKAPARRRTVWAGAAFLATGKNKRVPGRMDPPSTRSACLPTLILTSIGIGRTAAAA